MTEGLNLSAIIMSLEKAAYHVEHDLARDEETASQLEQAAEQLYRLAGRIRRGNHRT